MTRLTPNEHGQVGNSRNNYRLIHQIVLMGASIYTIVRLACYAVAQAANAAALYRLVLANRFNLEHIIEEAPNSLLFSLESGMH